MGGAFIAVADDATAASWNPGGLIQLETPEISIVGSFFRRSEDISFGTNPEASGSESYSRIDINYLSAVYPFTLWGLNMVISLNHQNLYDFTRKWKMGFHTEQGPAVLDELVSSRQEGTLSALGLAYCIQVTPHLSFGVTFNVWDDIFGNNGWRSESTELGSGRIFGNPWSYTINTVEHNSFEGYNLNFGLLWSLNNKLTIGAVFKTPFTADLEYDLSQQTENTYLGVTTFRSYSLKENRKLYMPASYGIGIAYRFSDELTTSFDIYRTEWDDFVLRDSNGNKTSPINSKPISQADIDATHQVRLGAEYLIIRPKFVIPVRAGVFYDPAPAEGNPDNYYGLSVGSGIAYGRFVFDIAYQYRFGNDVGASILQNLDFSQDLQEHTVYASLIFHLN